jgi:hypothetical protein
LSNQENIEPRWWRRFYIAWAVFAVIHGGVQASSVLMEYARLGIALPPWQPLVNEYTGIFALVALLPVIRWFDGRFPIRRDTWQTALPAHLLMTIPFALVHSALFVVVRKLIFPLFGSTYTFGELGFELLYEYRKITIGYGLAVLSLYAFRHYVLLRRLLEMPDAAAAEMRSQDPPPLATTPRFLARHAHREVIVNAADIRYVEAAGNYVVLHTPQGQLKLRETISNMERELGARDFLRVHRSYLVNLDAVKEIQPWFHGDQRLVLCDGTLLNLSRRYRDALKLRTAPAPSAASR